MRKTNRTKIIAVRVPEKIYNELKRRAEEDETSISEILRYYVLKHIGIFGGDRDDSGKS